MQSAWHMASSHYILAFFFSISLWKFQTSGIMRTWINKESLNQLLILWLSEATKQPSTQHREVESSSLFYERNYFFQERLLPEILDVNTSDVQSSFLGPLIPQQVLIARTQMWYLIPVIPYFCSWQRTNSWSDFRWLLYLTTRGEKWLPPKVMSINFSQEREKGICDRPRPRRRKECGPFFCPPRAPQFYILEGT